MDAWRRIIDALCALSPELAIIVIVFRGKPKIRGAVDEDVYYKKIGISQSLSGLPLRDSTNYRLYLYLVLLLSRLPASISGQLP